MIGKKTSSQWLPVAAGMVLLLSGMHASAENTFRADLNRDGKIDGSDVTIMNAEMGRDDCSSSPCRADLSGDGRVTSADLEIFRDEFKSSRLSAGTVDVPAEQVMMAPAEEGLQPPPEEEEAEAPSAEADEGGRLGKDRPLNVRFEDNKNGTVTDKETGLMWTKNADLFGDTLLYHQALDYIEAMNRGEQPNFSRTDWRLPTLAELRSLIDYTKLSRSTDRLPDGHPFENVKKLNLSSTSYVTDTDHSWFVSLYCRLVGHNVESCFGHVWAVRGGSEKPDGVME